MRCFLILILVQTNIWGFSQSDSYFFKNGICFSNIDSSLFTGEVIYEGNSNILDYKTISYYKDGSRQYSRSFYPNNELKSFDSWNSAFSHSINYYKGMKVRNIQERRNGVLYCNSVTWYETGTVLEKGEFYLGKKIGDFTSFYKTGELLSIVSYDSTGVKLSFESFHQNGNYYQKGIYYKNGLSKVFDEWDENGVLILNSYWDEKNHKMITNCFNSNGIKINCSK